MVESSTMYSNVSNRMMQRWESGASMTNLKAFKATASMCIPSGPSFVDCWLVR